MEEGQLKNEIKTIGQLLWQKNLVSGRNGNISCRVDSQKFLLSCHGSSLGFLKHKDLLLMDMDGNALEEGEVSTEKNLHLAIYKNIPAIKAVIHTHTPYINSYFSVNEKLLPFTFETKLYLGEVRAVAQDTPSVTQIEPVIESLKKNNILVIKNHGVVAVGENLWDCFFLIQALEEAVMTEALKKIFEEKTLDNQQVQNIGSLPEHKSNKKFKIFSREQIDYIVKLANEDKQLEELGKSTVLTTNLAVKMDETGQVYSFQFENGKIVKIGNAEQVEFLISGPKQVWQQIFNRELDPFVATTQKKLKLKGDFAKISQWYVPFSRLFELWQNVPVED
ncbi:MAG: class II aldolase/adducin family protein [Candidatus Omnitrophota bacterium]|nr:class II aldolase/adducin family protein [Candidatus Omnitrophota bacterium]